MGRVLRNLANSAMKVLAAYRPEADRQRLLRMRHLKLTPHTKTDPDEIARELDQVANEGLAYDIEEQDLGVCAVSAPVFGPGGEVRAVITVVAPAERFGLRERKRRAEAVQNAARQIGHSLGGGMPPRFD